MGPHALTALLRALSRTSEDKDGAVVASYPNVTLEELNISHNNILALRGPDGARLTNDSWAKDISSCFMHLAFLSRLGMSSVFISENDFVQLSLFGLSKVHRV